MTTGAIRCSTICSAAEMPSSPGILTSRMTRSGRSSSASRPPLAVAGLADDVVALLREHLDEVEADQRLVLGDDDSSRLPGHTGQGIGRDPAAAVR